MVETRPHLELRLNIDEPIAVADFIAAFTSVSSQFERFIRTQRPDLAADAQISVREIRSGSIIADLIPWVQHSIATVTPYAEQATTLGKFVQTYGGMISAYLKPKGRVADASKSDLRDLLDGVAAIANSSEGSASLSAVYFEDGKSQVKAAVVFTASEARAARDRITEHQRELEHRTGADRQRVIMRFVQSNITSSTPGKATGEKVIIEQVSPRALPLIYASDLAEQRVKHEVREASDNVFKKGFDVDVNVETQGDRHVAYRVTHVHAVFDLPED